MKKLSKIIATVVATTLILGGCGGKKDENKIVVGASSTPHAEILEAVQDDLKEKGYDLEIKIYDEYVLPNRALADKTLDANYFQHKPFLDSFNDANNTTLTSEGAVHYEPFGIYGNGIADLKDLKKGATIIVPADDSNETRALLLLQQEKLIKLPEGASAIKGVSTLDIVDNGGFDIKTVKADTVAAQLKNADQGSIAVINGNFAIGAGLKIENALAIEDASGDAAKTYANIIAVREEDKDSEKIKALYEALKSETAKKFMKEKYKGAVIPSL